MSSLQLPAAAGQFDPPALGKTPAVSADDRLPTFAEVDGFDANAAYDRLSAIEQRRVGILAVRLGVVGQPLNFEHGDWTRQQVALIEARESNDLSWFFDAIEPLSARLFGWVPPSRSTPGTEGSA